MSQENVEIVRRAYECFNEGDVEGVLELCDKGFEFRDLPELPGSGVYVGHEAFRGWVNQVTDAFDGLHFDVGELIDAGDSVVVVTDGAGRGKSSGALVEMHFSAVWRLQNGRLIESVNYSKHAEALEAAGLSE
ncbi:MAG: nuclear transport factor 2 family protein [Solirubrobacterales bacterium]